MPRGTSRTWACLCGIDHLPCLFHLATHMKVAAIDLADDLDMAVADLIRMPLFHNTQGKVVSSSSWSRPSSIWHKHAGNPLYPMKAYDYLEGTRRG